MRNELYIPLRDRIAKAVPEIMELKFGCKVIVSHKPTANGLAAGGDVSYVIISVEDCDSYGVTSELDGEPMSNPEIEFFEEKEFSKILGRDIALTDVLRAVHESCPKTVSVAIDGSEINEGTLKFERIGLRLLRDWDLFLPLREQGDELGEWLAGVIVGERVH